MDFWHPEEDAPVDPNWWAPLLRFGLQIFEELPADESDWSSDDLSAA
jgi:hypothetical protein